MSRIDVGVCVCRSLAIWLVIQLALVIPDIVASLLDTGPRPRFGLELAANIGVRLGLAIGLWKGAPWIAARMLPESASELRNPATPVKSGELYRIAFTAVGAYVLISSAPALASDLVTLARAELGAETISRGVLRELFTTALGLWLFLDASRVANFCRRLETARLAKS